MTLRKVARLAGCLSGVVLSSVGTAHAAVSTGEAAAQGAPFSFVMTAADVPTLGEWAVITLLVLMAVYAALRLRKHPAMMRAGLGLLVLVSTSTLIAGLGGSALSVASHDPATMLGAPQGHSRQVSVRLEAEAGQAVSGMTVHYRKAGGAWKLVAGAAAPTQACPDCWAATMDTTGWIIGDVVEYYFESIAAGSSAFVYRHPCSEHGSFAGGTCTCDAGYAGASCDGCAFGYHAYPDCVDDPCVPDPCNGHGTCDGGTCTCAEGYHGADCGFSCSDGTKNGDEIGTDCGGATCLACVCDSAHYGPDCAAEVTCDTSHGTCSAGSCYGTAGNGHCDSGSCGTGWAGADCDTCASGYYGATCAACPTCGANQVCNDGKTGTGACVCAPGYTGPTCSGQTCVAWRQTGECVWNGPREPWWDQPCTSWIPWDASGYCECAHGQVNANCGHAGNTCATVCANQAW